MPEPTFPRKRGRGLLRDEAGGAAARPVLLAAALVAAVVALVTAAALALDPPWSGAGSPAGPLARPASGEPSGGTPAARPTEQEEAGVEVPVGADLQALVDAHPAGTLFRLAPGIHRGQEVRPKDGSAFVGSAGTVLSGARVLTEFRQDGGHWYAGGQEQEQGTHGECDAAAPLCDRPERVFLDGRVGRPVPSRDELAPGAVFFDYGADRIWFGSDPRRVVVEAASARHAFSGPAAAVRLRDLVVEKYANRAQTGAVDASDGTDWTLHRVTARLNSGGGLRAGSGTRITDSSAVDNGQIGVLGTGADILVERTEIARNNTAGFAPGWEAGGTKFSRTVGLVVRACSVRDNVGHGLWTDVDNVGTTYVDNVVEDNSGEGVFHEISGSAVIRDNVVRRNGSGFSRWVFGAGIHVASSYDVLVVGNVVEGNANGIVGSQQDRGSGPHGRRRLADLRVEDNVVRDSGLVGVAQDVGDEGVFRDPGNRFSGNSYGPGQVFVWDDRELDLEQWQAQGHDRDGRATG